MTELAGLGPYNRWLLAHAPRVLGGEAEVDVRGLSPGTYRGCAPTDALANAFIYLRVCEQIIDNALRAEREGYDAFIIGSFSEPFLREIRSAVQIPVASVLESSMLLACSFGKKAVAIANAPSIAFMVQLAIERHGLESRVLPVRSVEPALTEPQMSQAYEQPGPVVDAFLRSARKAVAEGADFIIPAESILATLMIDNGITDIDGAPVMDVIAGVWRYAVMLVRLRESTGLAASRIGYYARAQPSLLAAFVEQK